MIVVNARLVRGDHLVLDDACHASAIHCRTLAIHNDAIVVVIMVGAVLYALVLEGTNELLIFDGSLRFRVVDDGRVLALYVLLKVFVILHLTN